MPVLIDPQFGGIYRYSTRRHSAVHIKNILGIQVDDKTKIDLSLRIPREVLETYIAVPATATRAPLLELASAIEITLAQLLGHKPPHRKPTLSIPLHKSQLDVPLQLWLLKELHGIPYVAGSEKIDARGIRIILKRKDLPLIEQWLTRPAPFREHRAFILLLLFFNRTYLELALMPARGENTGRKLFRHYLRPAYFACQELVRVAGEAPGSVVDERINRIISELKRTSKKAKKLLLEAERCSELYRDQAETVCLVYWAFDGAWQRYHLDGLLEPRQAYRQYYYGRERLALKRSHETVRTKHQDIYDNAFEWWNKIYLGKRGAAAKALHLTS